MQSVRPLILLSLIADLSQDEFADFMERFREVMQRAREAHDNALAADAADAQHGEAQLESESEEARAAAALAAAAIGKAGMH
jgi:hypothetical protein